MSTIPGGSKGNNNTDASFLDVLFALKDNIMKDLNVADIVTVISVDDDNRKFRCKLLANPNLQVECTNLQSLEVKVNDVMLAVFTTSDFRTNLSKVKNDQQLLKIENQTLHSKNYGVLVGLIYRKETEEN